MMSNDAFLLGIAPTVDQAPFMDATQLNAAVGSNVGNLAFVHAIDKQLGGALPRLNRGEKIEKINAMPGTAVLPCANHLGVHVNLAREAAHFARIERPMVAIGLGAQGGYAMEALPELPEGSIRWLRVLAEHAPTAAPNISVRGEFSLRLLEKHGVADRGVALGCPSLFINPAPALGQQVMAAIERPIKRVAVAAGHYRWTHMKKLEASLAQLVDQTGGAYILQSPLQMLKLYRNESQALLPADIDSLRSSILPHGSNEDVIEWYRRYSRAFFDVPTWMNYLRQFDFVIGARIHGVMLAIQAGVPGVCVAHDSRTLELCQTMALPYVLPAQVRNGLTLDQMRSTFNFDPDAFDKRRKELAGNYGAFLRGNGLMSMDLLHG
ncbi:MAG: polysaccharide pyruvyl transferase family protein [Pseudomonadota bacterium]|nr:polysaccharide pyruvyl transferase family protein [Pseudomonadota bacterium]